MVGGIALALMLPTILLALFWGPTYVAQAALSVRATDNGLGPEEPVAGEADPTAQASVGQSSEALIDKVWDEVSPTELSRQTMRQVGWTSGLQEFNTRLEVEKAYSAGEILVSFSAEDAGEARRVAGAYAEVFVERTEELNRQGPVGGGLAAEFEVARERSSCAEGCRLRCCMGERPGSPACCWVAGWPSPSRAGHASGAGL